MLTLKNRTPFNLLVDLEDILFRTYGVRVVFRADSSKEWMQGTPSQFKALAKKLSDPSVVTVKQWRDVLKENVSYDAGSRGHMLIPTRFSRRDIVVLTPVGTIASGQSHIANVRFHQGVL